ncbi:hypothetical protein PanWU01x14_020580, partial [Parasponia andersonii]
FGDISTKCVGKGHHQEGISRQERASVKVDKKYLLQRSGELRREYSFADKFLSTLVANKILHLESLFTFSDVFLHLYRHLNSSAKMMILVVFTPSNDPDMHLDFKPTSKLESSGLSLKGVVE